MAHEIGQDFAARCLAMEYLQFRLVCAEHELEMVRSREVTLKMQLADLMRVQAEKEAENAKLKKEKEILQQGNRELQEMVDAFSLKATRRLTQSRLMIDAQATQDE